MTTTQPSSHKEILCVFLIDGTKNMENHFKPMLDNLIDHFIKQLSQPTVIPTNEGGPKKSLPLIKFSYVVYRDYAPSSQSTVSRDQFTPNKQKFLSRLRQTKFEYGGPRYSAVGEGMAAALELFDEDRKKRHSESKQDPIRHVVIVGSTVPHDVKIKKNFNEEYDDFTLEDICSALKNYNVYLSTITAGYALSELNSLIEKVNGSELKTTKYAIKDNLTYLSRISGITIPNDYKLPENLIIIPSNDKKRPISNIANGSAAPLKAAKVTKSISQNGEEKQGVPTMQPIKTPTPSKDAPYVPNNVTIPKQTPPQEKIKVDSSEKAQQQSVEESLPVINQKMVQTPKKEETNDQLVVRKDSLTTLSTVPHTQSPIIESKKPSSFTQPPTPSVPNASQADSTSMNRSISAKSPKGIKDTFSRKGSKSSNIPLAKGRTKRQNTSEKITTVPGGTSNVLPNPITDPNATSQITNQVKNEQSNVNNLNQQSMNIPAISNQTHPTSTPKVAAQSVQMSAHPSQVGANVHTSNMTQGVINSFNIANNQQLAQSQGNVPQNFGQYNNQNQQLQNYQQQIMANYSGIVNRPTNQIFQGNNIPNTQNFNPQISTQNIMANGIQNQQLNNMNFQNQQNMLMNNQNNQVINQNYNMNNFKMNNMTPQQQNQVNGQINNQASNQMNNNLNAAQTISAQNNIQNPNVQNRQQMAAPRQQTNNGNASGPQKTSPQKLWVGRFGLRTMGQGGAPIENTCLANAGVPPQQQTKLSEIYSIDKWPQSLIISSFQLCNIDGVINHIKQNSINTFLLYPNPDDPTFPKFEAITSKLDNEKCIAISVIPIPEGSPQGTYGFLFFKRTGKVIGIPFIKKPIPPLESFGEVPGQQVNTNTQMQQVNNNAQMQQINNVNTMAANLNTLRNQQVRPNRMPENINQAMQNQVMQNQAMQNQVLQNQVMQNQAIQQNPAFAQYLAAQQNGMMNNGMNVMARAQMQMNPRLAAMGQNAAYNNAQGFTPQQMMQRNVANNVVQQQIQRQMNIGNRPNMQQQRVNPNFNPNFNLQALQASQMHQNMNFHNQMNRPQ